VQHKKVGVFFLAPIGTSNNSLGFQPQAVVALPQFCIDGFLWLKPGHYFCLAVLRCSWICRNTSTNKITIHLIPHSAAHNQSPQPILSLSANAPETALPNPHNPRFGKSSQPDVGANLVFARLELKLQAIPVSSLKGLEVFN